MPTSHEKENALKKINLINSLHLTAKHIFHTIDVRCVKLEFRFHPQTAFSARILCNMNRRKRLQGVRHIRTRIVNSELCEFRKKHKTARHPLTYIYEMCVCDIGLRRQLEAKHTSYQSYAFFTRQNVGNGADCTSVRMRFRNLLLGAPNCLSLIFILE